MSIIKKYQPLKSNCKVTFSYPAQEGVNNVKVLGDFNNWDPSVAPTMKKSKSDFSASLELNLGQTYEFRYLINDNQWENDLSADKYVASPFGGIENSVLVIDAVETKTAPKKGTAKTPVAKTPVAKATVTKAATAKKAAPATKAAPKKEAAVKTATKASKGTPAKATTAKTTVKTAAKNNLKKI